MTPYAQEQNRVSINVSVNNSNITRDGKSALILQKTS